MTVLMALVKSKNLFSWNRKLHNLTRFYSTALFQLLSQPSPAAIAMLSLLASTLSLLSIARLTGASSLRERNLDIAPRTVYEFSYNYADSDCSQLVSATMDVSYASTSALYNDPCFPERASNGQTVYFKKVLSELNQYESCVTGIAFR